MDDEERGPLALSQKFRWIDLAILGVDTARKLACVASDALYGIEVILVGQANFMVDQQAFLEDARAQIESITQEE